MINPHDSHHVPDSVSIASPHHRGDASLSVEENPESDVVLQLFDDLRQALAELELAHEELKLKYHEIQQSNDDSCLKHQIIMFDNQIIMAENHKLKEELDLLTQRMDQLLRSLYGRRGERFDDPNQGRLFDFNEEEIVPPETPQTPETPDPTPEKQAVAASKKTTRSRKLDFSRLPHVRIERDVPDAEKNCSCCGEPMAKIGEDEHRELEYIPAHFEVRINVLPKYACSRCRDGVTSPKGPTRPIEGCIAGPGLLAEILTSKYIDHLPLYRLENISARLGLHLPRATLCDWVRKSAELMQPFYELQKKLVLQSPVIWTDDTTVKVLSKDDPRGSLTGRFWVYHGYSDHPYDVYDFTPNRKREGPEKFLEGFQGYLQADAYGGYDEIYLGSQETIVEVACWAHARRKFYEARSSSPGHAEMVLAAIRLLYDVEDRARYLSNEERRELRKQESTPILERIRDLIERFTLEMLPKSAMGKALTYTRNQWDALCRYVEDGRLTIDNNVCERRIRDQAIGRKNWLFIGTVEAGPRAAVLFTIMAGAKRHCLEPVAYIKDVLITLSQAPERIEDLLPDRWAKSHSEHVLTHRLEESREKARRRDAERATRRE